MLHGAIIPKLQESVAGKRKNAAMRAKDPGATFSPLERCGAIERAPHVYEYHPCNTERG
jgi:hypothetical protein